PRRAARDLAERRVRVMTIAPGLFDTPLLATVSDDLRAALAAGIPHPRRLGSPGEYAALVVQCVENPMLHGECIRLDRALGLPPAGAPACPTIPPSSPMPRVASSPSRSTARRPAMPSTGRWPRAWP